jgi:hypothetical protein
MSEQRKFLPNLTALDDASLSIRGEPWDNNNPKNAPTLFVRIPDSANNPNTDPKHRPKVGVRLMCYFNNPDIAGDNKGELHLNPFSAYIFLNLLREAVRDPQYKAKGLLIRGKPFGADKVEELGSVKVALNGEGEVCIILEISGKPTARFKMTPTYWEDLIDLEGNPLDKAKASRLVTLGWIDVLSGLIPNVSTEVYNKKFEVWKKKNKSGAPSGKPNTSSHGSSEKTDTSSDIYAEFY